MVSSVFFVCIFTGIIGSSFTVDFQPTSNTSIEIWEKSRTRRSTQRNIIVGTDPDSALVAQSSMDLPWEQYIVCGPGTVNLLGQLMVVSSKLDFSFRDYMPGYTFTAMRFPNSFRATLTQIANDGWQAFMGAHSNMDKIQIAMGLVPSHVKTALRVLASRSATPRIINLLLPDTLREIERLGKSCVMWANATHTSFVNVMVLIGEVISVTETARGLQETKLRQTEIELNASIVMKGELTKLAETIRQHYNEARESVRKAQEEYSRALRKVPTGFQSVLLELGRAIIGVMNTVSQAFTRIGGGGGGGETGTQDIASMSGAQTLTFTRLFFDTLCKAVPRIKRILDSINTDSTGNTTTASTATTTITTTTTTTTNNNKRPASSNPNQELEAYKITFETYLSSVVSGPESNIKQNAVQIIQKGIALIDETSHRIKNYYGVGENIKEGVVKDLKQRFDELIDEVKPMVAAERANGAGVPPSSSNSMGDSSQNEKFAVQLTMDRLKSAESRADRIFKHLKQNQQELSKLMSKIASLDMNRIRYREILELLREALRLLAKIREQWGQLVLFFAEVAIRAEMTMSGTLTPFIAQATQAGGESFTREERLFYVDILKAQASEIDSQTQMLYLMSRTYVDMSAQYIMGRLAGLSKMLGARDDTERSRLLSQLNQESENNLQAVMELITQRKNNYQSAIQKRRIELQGFLAKLGGPDADDQLAIEAGKALLKQ